MNLQIRAWLAGLTLLTAASGAAAQAPLIICYSATHSALVPLAKQLDFYRAEGLTVELRQLPSGRATLQAMFDGACAMATAAENPVVHVSLARNDFRILAAISVSNNMERILVRSDRSIFTAADLRGRRIAVPEFTTAHYFLDIFLEANGVASQEVSRVYLPAQDMAPAFRRGEVDALVHWEPNIQTLAKEFSATGKTLDAPGLHIAPMLLVAGRDYLRQNPATVERVLRALLRAETYARQEPAKTKPLMASNYALGQAEIELVWPLHEWQVTLDQSLLLMLENAARWELGLLPPNQRAPLPNYLDFIHLDALRRVKPAAVSIIH